MLELTGRKPEIKDFPQTGWTCSDRKGSEGTKTHQSNSRLGKSGIHGVGWKRLWGGDMGDVEV